MLALFWVSPFGVSTLNSDREHLLSNLRGLVDCLQRDQKAQQARMSYVLALADTGAANGPLWGSPSTAEGAALGGSVVSIGRAASQVT